MIIREVIGEEFLLDITAAVGHLGRDEQGRYRPQSTIRRLCPSIACDVATHRALYSMEQLTKAFRPREDNAVPTRASHKRPTRQKAAA